MDKKEYFKKIWSLGNLVVGYTELKVFDTKTALTFARLNTEYNYAVGHNYLLNNYCFAYDEREIASCIGLSVEDVKTAIETLKMLSFIKIINIEPFKFIHLKLNYISSYIERAEKENDLNLWDFGLNTIQGNAFASIEFDSENKNLIPNPEKELSELATDENGNPIYF